MTTLKFKDGSVEITKADLKAIPYFATLMESKFQDAKTFQLEDVTVADWQIYRGVKPDSSLQEKLQALYLADRLIDSKCLATILEHMVVTRQDINLWVHLLTMSGQLIMESSSWPALQSQLAHFISLGLPDEMIKSWSEDCLGFVLTEFNLNPVVRLDLITQWFVCNGMLEMIKLPIREAFKTKASQLPVITARLIRLGRIEWLMEALEASIGSVENFTLRQPENLRIVDYRDFDITKLSFGEVVTKRSSDEFTVTINGFQKTYDSQSCLYEGLPWALSVPEAEIQLVHDCGPSLRYPTGVETKGWSHLEKVLQDMTRTAVLAIPESKHRPFRAAQTYSHKAGWAHAFVSLKFNSQTHIHNHTTGEPLEQHPKGWLRGHDILLSFYLYSNPEMGRMSLIRQLRQAYIEV